MSFTNACSGVLATRAKKVGHLDVHSPLIYSSLISRFSSDLSILSGLINLISSSYLVSHFISSHVVSLYLVPSALLIFPHLSSTELSSSILIYSLVIYLLCLVVTCPKIRPSLTQSHCL